MKSQWIDVSLSLRNSLVRWPGDPVVKIERVSDRKQGNKYNLSRITMGSHSGTHVDAPLHIIDNGPGVDLMNLDTAIGKARVIEIKDRVSIKPEEILKYHLRTGERILFKTTNSSKACESDEFYKDFVFLSDDAALLLSQLKLRLVGVDYL
jgi:arylformamidase